MKLNRNLVIEKEGIYKQIKYFICFNMLVGFRVGYALFDKNLNFDMNSIEVHGGVTFNKVTDKHPIALDKQYLVVGFDAGHVYDGIDYENWERYNDMFRHKSVENFKNIKKMISYNKYDEFKPLNISMMENEIYNMIDDINKKIERNLK
jgi:hypothetical protein